MFIPKAILYNIDEISAGKEFSHMDKNIGKPVHHFKGGKNGRNISPFSRRLALLSGFEYSRDKEGERVNSIPQSGSKPANHAKCIK
jgi:hypothetical protein